MKRPSKTVLRAALAAQEAEIRALFPARAMSDELKMWIYLRTSQGEQRVFGSLVIADTRLSVLVVGRSPESDATLLADYPYLAAEDLRFAREYAAFVDAQR